MIYLLFSNLSFQAKPPNTIFSGGEAEDKA
jgi:hypothetical protein